MVKIKNKRDVYLGLESDRGIVVAIVKNTPDDELNILVKFEQFTNKNHTVRVEKYKNVKWEPGMWNCYERWLKPTLSDLFQEDL